MFGRFGKKKAEKAPRENPAPQESGSEESRAFAADFLPEELDILAVTGAGGFGAVPHGSGEDLWIASIWLTAWMEEDSPEIHEGEVRLETLANEQLKDYLHSRVPGDFIIKCRARVSRDGSRLLMLTLPEPAFDPDLKAILERQKKPQTFEAEGLGTFTLIRTVGWFEAEVDWLGAPIQLDIDRSEDRDDAVKHAQALVQDQEKWDCALREYAAGKLLEQARTADGSSALTAEEFYARLEPESVQVTGDGRFEFWFHDSEMVLEQAIRVSGSLESGPDDAAMEG